MSYRPYRFGKCIGHAVLILDRWICVGHDRVQDPASQKYPVSAFRIDQPASNRDICFSDLFFCQAGTWLGPLIREPKLGSTELRSQ